MVENNSKEINREKRDLAKKNTKLTTRGFKSYEQFKKLYNIDENEAKAIETDRRKIYRGEKQEFKNDDKRETIRSIDVIKAKNARIVRIAENLKSLLNAEEISPLPKSEEGGDPSSDEQNAAKQQKEELLKRYEKFREELSDLKKLLPSVVETKDKQPVKNVWTKQVWALDGEKVMANMEASDEGKHLRRTFKNVLDNALAYEKMIEKEIQERQKFLGETVEDPYRKAEIIPSDKIKDSIKSIKGDILKLMEENLKRIEKSKWKQERSIESKEADLSGEGATGRVSYWEMRKLVKSLESEDIDWVNYIEKRSQYYHMDRGALQGKREAISDNIIELEEKKSQLEAKIPTTKELAQKYGEIEGNLRTTQQIIELVKSQGKDVDQNLEQDKQRLEKELSDTKEEYENKLGEIDSEEAEKAKKELKDVESEIKKLEREVANVDMEILRKTEDLKGTLENKLQSFLEKQQEITNYENKKQEEQKELQEIIKNIINKKGEKEPISLMGIGKEIADYETKNDKKEKTKIKDIRVKVMKLKTEIDTIKEQIKAQKHIEGKEGELSRLINLGKLMSDVKQEKRKLEVFRYESEKSIKALNDLLKYFKRIEAGGIIGEKSSGETVIEKKAGQLDGPTKEVLNTVREEVQKLLKSFEEKVQEFNTEIEKREKGLKEVAEASKDTKIDKLRRFLRIFKERSVIRKFDKKFGETGDQEKEQ